MARWQQYSQAIQFALQKDKDRGIKLVKSVLLKLEIKDLKRLEYLLQNNAEICCLLLVRPIVEYESTILIPTSSVLNLSLRQFYRTVEEDTTLNLNSLKETFWF